MAGRIVSATYADIDVLDKIRDQYEKQKDTGRVSFTDFVPILADYDPQPDVRKYVVVKLDDGTEIKRGDGEVFECIHDHKLHETIVGRSYDDSIMSTLPKPSMPLATTRPHS